MLSAPRRLLPPSPFLSSPLFFPFTCRGGKGKAARLSSIHPFAAAKISSEAPMGLSSLPTPSDGVLTLVLVNTALSFSLFKQIIRSILHSIGFDSYYLFGSDLDDISEPSSTDVTDSISHLFKTQVKAVRFGHRANSGPEQVHHLDCRVCLSRFEPDSFVYHLPCGHFFHVLCLAKWLDYHHATCPLCRTKVFPNSFHDDVDVSCPQVY